MLEELQEQVDRDSAELEISKNWKRGNFYFWLNIIVYLGISKDYAQRVSKVLEERRKRNSQKMQKLQEIYLTQYEGYTDKIKQLKEDQQDKQNEQQLRFIHQLEDQVEEIERLISRTKDENEVYEQVI